MRIFHLAIPSHDLNASRTFYTGVFGATVGAAYDHYVINIKGKNFVVVASAGLISHTVDRLLKEDVDELIVYDFFYVKDCTKANICTFKTDTSDQFYNVGTVVHTSIKTLAKKIFTLSNADLAIRYKPAGLIFVKNRIGYPIKAKREIGFEASVPLELGLKKLIAWRNSYIKKVRLKRDKVLA